MSTIEEASIAVLIFTLFMVESILKDDNEGHFIPDNVRIIAALTYLVFFIPLIVTPDNPFTKYHAAQSFNLLIATVVIMLASWLVPLLGLYVILPAGGLFVVTLFIMGINHSVRGKMQPLPVLGNIQLLKV